MDLVAAWRQAQLGEIVWDRAVGHGPTSGPDAMVVVPLTDEGTPCVALPFAHLEAAESLQRAGTAVITVSDPALCRGAQPMQERVRVTRHDDTDGAHFEASKMLLQELAKHPPSRRRIDSIILRREHWWFMPRILLRLEPLSDASPLLPGDGILGVRTSSGLEVATATITERRPETVLIDAVRRAELAGPAVLLSHGAEPPDLEVHWADRWHGTLTQGQLTVTDHESKGRRDGAPRLLQRVRDEWLLERQCRAGLRSVGVDA
jgi:hypothetical protein